MTLVGATLGRKPTVRNGTSTPAGSVTPRGYGDIFVDTSGGVVYMADGLTNADWLAVSTADSTAYTAYSPTFDFATASATTWTYGTQQGRYKIIGKTCYVMIRVNATLTTKGAASGYFFISLPATPRNSLQGTWEVSNRAANFVVPTNTLWLSGVPVGNLAQVAITANKSGAVNENLDSGDFTEGNTYEFTTSGFFEIA